MTDPVVQLSNQFIKEVLIELRNERSDLKNRIRYACDSANSDDEIEILILGTGELTQKRLRKISEQHIEYMYLESVTRAISDISTTDIYRPTAVPAYITAQDREVGAVDSINYVMSLLTATIQARNESIKKIIFSRSKGITKLIDDVESEINKIWIPRIETDIRIGCNHAWNAAYYTRLSGYGTFKKWVSGSDHDEMNEVIVPVNEPFIVPAYVDPENITQKVPGCEMLYPGDISGNPDRRHLEKCFCRVISVSQGPVTLANVTEENLTSANEPDERNGDEPEEKKRGRKKKQEDE